MNWFLKALELVSKKMRCSFSGSVDLSIYLFAHAVSSCLEVFLDRPIPNLFRISFGTASSPAIAKQNWQPLLDVLFPFCTHLNIAIDDGLKNNKDIDAAVNNLKSLVASTSGFNQEIYSTFKNVVKAP